MENASRQLVKVLSPEETELNLKENELSQLENQLAEMELSLSTLKNNLYYFNLKYIKIIGICFAKLDELKAQIAELLAKENPDDSSYCNRAHQARQQANQSSTEIGDERFLHEDTNSFSPSDNLKKLYRDIAKKVHPDFASDSADREIREKYMKEATCAYQQCDESKLMQILKDWESRPESVTGDGIAEKLIRIIRKIAQIKNRILMIKKEI